MIGRNVLYLDGLDAEQAIGDVEAGLNDVFELQVGLQLGFGEIEHSLAQLLRVMAPVPRHNIVVAAFLRDQPREACLLLECTAAGLLPDRRQQVVHSPGRLRHGIVELVGRKILIAEQCRLFGTKRQRLTHDCQVVGIAAVGAARHPGGKRPLPQVTPLRKGQERLDDRAGQGDGIAFLLASFARGSSHCLAKESRQPGKVRVLPEKEDPAPLVRKYVLPEACAEPGQCLVDPCQPFLVRLRQLRSGAHEAFPVPLEDTVLLPRQTQFLTSRPETVDPVEQRLVHRDLRIVP